MPNIFAYFIFDIELLLDNKSMVPTPYHIPMVLITKMNK